jgi:hypothetical protein
MEDIGASGTRPAADLLVQALQSVATEAVRRVIGHYFAVHSTAAVPSRLAIDPTKMRDILPNVILLDATVGDRFPIRLAGTGFRNRLGREITGTNWLDLIPEASRGAMASCLGTLLSQPCGAHFLVAEGWRLDPCLEYVLLPLTSPGASATDMLFGAAALIREPDIGDWRAPVTAQPMRYIDIGRAVPEKHPISATAEASATPDNGSADQSPGLFRHDAS